MGSDDELEGTCIPDGTFDEWRSHVPNLFVLCIRLVPLLALPANEQRGFGQTNAADGRSHTADNHSKWYPKRGYSHVDKLDHFDELNLRNGCQTKLYRIGVSNSSCAHFESIVISPSYGFKRSELAHTSFTACIDEELVYSPVQYRTLGLEPAHLRRQAQTNTRIL